MKKWRYALTIVLLSLIMTTLDNSLTDKITELTRHSSEQGPIEIVDTVSLNKLTVGETYIITGTVIDKKTGNAILDNEGNPITSTTEFTAEKEYAKIPITFYLPQDAKIDDGSRMTVSTQIHAEVEK